jgi:hypothetical protein
MRSYQRTGEMLARGDLIVNESGWPLHPYVSAFTRYGPSPVWRCRHKSRRVCDDVY